MKAQTPETELIFEPLNRKHDRQNFTCGNNKLDIYLRTQSSQDVKKHLAAVFVLSNGGTAIVGFYTLSQCSVESDHIPDEISRKLTRHHTIPTTLIGRLAISETYTGKGFGSMLLMDALYRSLAGSNQIASWAVIVDAKDASAVSFYKKFGFIEIPAIPQRLFLPMATIEKLFDTTTF